MITTLRSNLIEAALREIADAGLEATEEEDDFLPPCDVLRIQLRKGHTPNLLSHISRGEEGKVFLNGQNFFLSWDYNGPDNTLRMYPSGEDVGNYPITVPRIVDILKKYGLCHASSLTSLHGITG